MVGLRIQEKATLSDKLTNSYSLCTTEAQPRGGDLEKRGSLHRIFSLWTRGSSH